MLGLGKKTEPVKAQIVIAVENGQVTVQAPGIDLTILLGMIEVAKVILSAPAINQVLMNQMKASQAAGKILTVPAGAAEVIAKNAKSEEGAKKDMHLIQLANP